VSWLVPNRPGGGGDRSDRPEPHLQGPLTRAEQVGRWEVRAAQWRALELARQVFGSEVRGSMIGVRPRGPMRGLMRLDVPFDELVRHRAREVRFLAMAGVDPLLARVPLLYVMGPAEEDPDGA